MIYTYLVAFKDAGEDLSAKRQAVRNVQTASQVLPDLVDCLCGLVVH